MSVERDISLLIPTMNKPGNVDRLLGTLKDFGYMDRMDFKPVVVDSSKDAATKQVTLSYSADYLAAEGLGKSKAMNLAIDHLDSEFIAFLDDDITIVNGN